MQAHFMNDHSMKYQKRVVLRRLAALAVLALAALYIFALGALAEVQSHIGLNQRVLVIPVKWADNPNTRMTGEEWVRLLNSEENDFFLRATHGKSSFRFERPTGPEVPADGWFTLEINQADSPGVTGVARLAVALADPYVDMANYNRLLVITNGVDAMGMPAFGGRTEGYQWIPVDEGSETTQVIEGTSQPVRGMCVSWGNEWIAGSGTPFDWGAATIAHEMGHQLDLQTHYSDIHWSPSMRRDALTPWDIMGISPTLTHFLAWAKAERGFLDPPRITTVSLPTRSDVDVTIPLEPQENTLTSGFQAIRVPFSNASPFSGYVIENRLQINGDESLPNPGVLVSLVDENPSIVYGTKAIVMDNPMFPADLNRAVLDPQQTFTDSARNIRITHVRRDANTSQVRIQYGFPPPGRPDPSIIPWGNPPWETPDIWIDSEVNGWGTYRYPDGNRDDAWVNHNNRVYVRIRNLGTAPASNVRVTVYQNDPPGLGDAGPNWVPLGTILVPFLAAGDPYTGYVIWRPTVARHTCLRAVIEPYPGELVSTNNIAQENVSNFDTTSSSPYTPVTLTQNVFSPFPTEDTPVHIVVRDIPKLWKWALDPEDMVIPAGEVGQVKVTLYPPDPALVPEYSQGKRFAPKIEAQVPFADSYVTIGGTEMRVHLTYKGALTCEPSVLDRNTMVVKGSLLQMQPQAGVPMIGERVAVDLIPQSGAGGTRTLFAETDASGRYNVKFAQVASGRYLVKAFFAGTMKVQMQECGPTEVVVSP